MEANVGDVVQAATVGATAHLDSNVVHPFVFQQPVPGCHLLAERLGQPHGASYTQLTAICARARDHVGNGVSIGFSQTDAGQFVPDVVEVRFGNEPQRQVLLLTGASPAAGVLAHDVGQRMELTGVDITAFRFNVNDVVTVLFLRLDVRLPPVAVLAVDIMTVSGHRRNNRRRLPLELLDAHVRGRVDGPNVFQLGFDHPFEFV